MFFVRLRETFSNLSDFWKILKTREDRNVQSSWDEKFSDPKMLSTTLSKEPHTKKLTLFVTFVLISDSDYSQRTIWDRAEAHFHLASHVCQRHCVVCGKYAFGGLSVWEATACEEVGDTEFLKTSLLVSHMCMTVIVGLSVRVWRTQNLVNIHFWSTAPCLKIRLIPPFSRLPYIFSRKQ